MVSNPPARAGDLGSVPGPEDPVEAETATHFSILAWEIAWAEKAGGLQSLRWQESDMT